MPVYKAQITVTVLIDEPSKEQATNILSNYSLESIAQEMDEGLFLGRHVLTSIEAVPSDSLVAECEAVGNDGSFFDYQRDEEEESES